MVAAEERLGWEGVVAYAAFIKGAPMSVPGAAKEIRPARRVGALSDAQQEATQRRLAIQAAGLGGQGEVGDLASCPLWRGRRFLYA
jgi:hypothetical protein